MGIKIEIDRESCIGCGACVAVCGDNWELKDDGKAAPIDDKPDDLGCNQEAADACPVNCIKIIKK